MPPRWGGRIIREPGCLRWRPRTAAGPQKVERLRAVCAVQPPQPGAGAPGTFSPRHELCRPALGCQAGWHGSPPAGRSRPWRNGIMSKKRPRAEWPPAASSRPAGSKIEPECRPEGAGTTSSGPLTAPDQCVRRLKGSQYLPLTRLQLNGGLMFWSLRTSL